MLAIFCNLSNHLGKREKIRYTIQPDGKLSSNVPINLKRRNGQKLEPLPVGAITIQQIDSAIQ